MSVRKAHNVRPLGRGPRTRLGVRALCTAGALAILFTSPLAKADCPAAPLASTNDMVVSFLAGQGGTQSAPSTLFASTVKEGMLVYDDTANALKICNGTAWQTLDVAGSSSPAAGTVAGAVQFRSATGTFAADDTNFVWDDTNNRLGIGTTAPSGMLHVLETTQGSIPLILDRDDASNYFLQLRNNGATQFQIDHSLGGVIAMQASYGLILSTGSNGNLSLSPNGTGNVLVTNGNVGIGTATPNVSALLDVTSTTKGLLPPRMTTAQVTAVATPADGLIVYDTDTDTIKLRANGAWVSLQAGAGAETDPQVGTLTASKWCLANAGGTAIDCTTDTPTLTETDPKVGTLTNTKWCSTDGLTISCTADAPSTTPTADSLDFTEFKDAMALDASTDIAASGTNELSITNVGTGNSFLVNDAASDTSPFVIDASGNVGIGTTSAAEKLDVSGNIRASFGNAGFAGGGMVLGFGSVATGNIAGGQLSIWDSGSQKIALVGSAGNGGINLSGDGSTLGWSSTASSQAAKDVGLSRGAAAKLYVGNGTAADYTGTLIAGNIGIGTTTPQAKLDVAGGTRVGADATCSAAKAGMLAWNSNTLQVCTDAGTFTNIASSSGGSSQWTTSGSDIYYNTGNVGIGTASPANAFDVLTSATSGTGARIFGDQNKERFIIESSISPVFQTGQYRGTSTGRTATQAGDMLGYYQAGGYDGTTQRFNQARIVMQATENHSATNQGTSLAFQTTPNGSTFTSIAARMTIDHTGNVGIGTTAPNASALLDVSSTTKGFLPPRVTTTERNAIATPAEGLTVYNTTTDGLETYSNGYWQAGAALRNVGRGTSGNYNTIIQNTPGGIWWMDGPGSTNGPTGTNTGTLVHLDPLWNQGASANQYAIQLATNGNAGDKLYFRHQYSGTWGNWVDLTASGSGSPGGATTQVQFNNAGAFGGDASFVWDNTNKRLGIGGMAPLSSLHVGSTASTGRNFQVGSDGRPVIRFDDNSQISALFIDNRGITAVGHGANINFGMAAASAAANTAARISAVVIAHPSASV